MSNRDEETQLAAECPMWRDRAEKAEARVAEYEGALREWHAAEKDYERFDGLAPTKVWQRSRDASMHVRGLAELVTSPVGEAERTPEGKALRESVPQEVVDRVLRRADELDQIAQRTNEAQITSPQAHGEPCYYCKEPCDGYAANPGRWPVGLSHPDEPGVLKWQHHQCVYERLHPSAWAPEVDLLLEVLGIVSKHVPPATCSDAELEVLERVDVLVDKLKAALLAEVPRPNEALLDPTLPPAVYGTHVPVANEAPHEHRFSHRCVECGAPSDIDDCVMTERQQAIDGFTKISSMVVHDSAIDQVASQCASTLIAGRSRTDKVMSELLEEWERQYLWSVDKLRWALGVIRTWDMLNPTAGAPEATGDAPFFRDMIDEVLSKTIPKHGTSDVPLSETAEPNPLTARVQRLRNLLAVVYALRTDGCTRKTCEMIDASCDLGMDLASMHCAHGSTVVMSKVFDRVRTLIDEPVPTGSNVRR